MATEGRNTLLNETQHWIESWRSSATATEDCNTLDVIAAVYRHQQ